MSVHITSEKIKKYEDHRVCQLVCRLEQLQHLIVQCSCSLKPYDGILRVTTFLKTAFAVQSLNSVSHFPVPTRILSVFLSSCLCLSFSHSRSGEVMWKFSYLCDSRLYPSDHHHHPLSSVHPSIHLFIQCETEQNREQICFVYSDLNSSSMNQSLVAARDTFSCFTLGALQQLKSVFACYMFNLLLIIDIWMVEKHCR